MVRKNQMNKKKKSQTWSPKPILLLIQGKLSLLWTQMLDFSTIQCWPWIELSFSSYDYTSSEDEKVTINWSYDLESIVQGHLWLQCAPMHMHHDFNWTRFTIKQRYSTEEKGATFWTVSPKIFHVRKKWKYLLAELCQHQDLWCLLRDVRDMEARTLRPHSGGIAASASEHRVWEAVAQEATRGPCQDKLMLPNICQGQRDWIPLYLG